MIRIMPRTFHWHGFLFKQVLRINMWTLYEQSQQGCIIAYEVVKLRVRRNTDGTLEEYYPGSSEWGWVAWSYLSLGEAKEQLVARSTQEVKHVAET